MYKATGQWQPNRYIQQFVSDGILYFLTYVARLFHPSLSFPSAAHHALHIRLALHYVSKN